MGTLARAVCGTAILIAFTACAAGQPISRAGALRIAARQQGVLHIDRSATKLMTAYEFTAATGASSSGFGTPGSQQVWVVAVAGDVRLGGAREAWAIFVLDAVSGRRLLTLSGPFQKDGGQPVGPAWPAYWDKLPDRGV